MAAKMKHCDQAQLPQNKTNKDIMTQNFDPHSKDLQMQEQNLKRFEQHEQKRKQFNNYVQLLLDRQPDETMIHDSDGFRAKQEAKELCDLGCSIDEKYGPYQSWKLSLRQSWDLKEKSKPKKIQKPITVIDEENETETPTVLDCRNSCG